jgi:tight adherence protein C
MNPLLPSLLLSTIAVSLLVLGENPMHDVRQLAGRTKDRSLVKSRMFELNRGSQVEYEEFRYLQFLYTSIAALIVFILSSLSNQSIVTTTFLSTSIAVAAYLYTDRTLTAAVKKQRSAIEAEFPAIIEMLTLAISAGESPLSAFKRIAENSHGYLSVRFRLVIARVHQGIPFHSALDLMGRDLNSPLVRKFIDSMVNAMVRGAPITDVLVRHAQEARDYQRNRVLAAAGKAEISMMIPVVFLILPISILFALWPSLTNLNLFAS